MKTASLVLITASSFCLALGAFAKDTVMLPNQQNQNCANRGGVKAVPQANAQQQRTDVANSAVPKVEGKIPSSSSKSEHPIDLVICLDTSSSMDGLIGSAKEKIWDIVNELATAKPRPHLRVGLYAYGSPSFGNQNGYVYKVLDLSDDLDKVFTDLTALRTNGGSEYCARAISEATKGQTWDKSNKALKIIVIAGNEPATQDQQLNVFDTAKNAISHGIIVNTIYCGSPAHPDAVDWRKVATMADGQFASIDQDRGTVVVSTPYDQKLAELSSSINRTYLAYGKGGSAGQQRQMQADSLSQQMGASNYAARTVAKVSGQYRNADWDLLDASKEGNFELKKMKKADLPQEMQAMSEVQQKDYLDQKSKERADIQKQISELNTQRAKYIQEEIKKSGKKTDKAFDTAMMNALRQQAQRNGFTFGSK